MLVHLRLDRLNINPQDITSHSDGVITFRLPAGPALWSFELPKGSPFHDFSDTELSSLKLKIDGLVLQEYLKSVLIETEAEGG